MDTRFIQFHVKPTTPSERDAIATVILEVVKQYSFTDIFYQSRIPDTLLNYAERQGTGMGLGARWIDETVIVDFNMAKAIDKTLCQNALAEITHALRERFSERFTRATAETYIEAVSFSRYPRQS